jgi:hypothetical protein
MSSSLGGLHVPKSISHQLEDSFTTIDELRLIVNDRASYTGTAE